jgi:hypothetical protein
VASVKAGILLETLTKYELGLSRLIPQKGGDNITDDEALAKWAVDLFREGRRHVVASGRVFPHRGNAQPDSLLEHHQDAC